MSLETMAALIFEKKLWKLIKGYLRGRRNPNNYWKPGGPVCIKKVSIPKLVSDDWVLIKTVYSGICGSDMKEVISCST